MMDTPRTNDEPLKIHEAVVVTAYIVTACAGVAIVFTTLAFCDAASGIIKRFAWKGPPHVS
jgi:hypothetical protein